MDSTPLTARSTANQEPLLIDKTAQASTIETIEASLLQDSVDESKEQPPSAILGTNKWILILTLTYEALAVFAWIALCVLTYRPLTAKSYHTMDRSLADDSSPRDLFRHNENWLRAVRVIQSTISVVTIPLTSAVCAKAAVVYTQTPPKKRNLTLRQTTTLASRGWNDPEIFVKLFRRGSERYYTRLLGFAIFLNILGGTISPLQSIFVRYSTTKTPSANDSILSGVPDVLDLVGSNAPSTDMNRVAILTRNAVTSTFSTDPQSRLWKRKSNCVTTWNSYGDLPVCSDQVSNLANISSLVDPFLAYLPSDFNTGLIKQYIPRMNSTATRDHVTKADFPSDCDQLPGAFYAHYFHVGEANNTNFAGNWSIIACMPANQSKSPWEPTRNRQDIFEEMYLNVSINVYPEGLINIAYNEQDPSIHALLKITLDTTLGYFELPNYFNGQTPGPLLNEYSDDDYYSNLWPRKWDLGSSGMSNSSVLLQNVPSKGPLLNLAFALFGEGSFISNRFQHPEAYLIDMTNDEASEARENGANWDLFDGACIEQEPMMGLFMGSSTDTSGARYPGCIRNLNNQDDVLQQHIEQWILSFVNNFGSDTTNNAFEAAAFLANEAWLVQGGYNGVGSTSIYYNLGVDTDVPVISVAGIIVVSILLSVFLAALLALAIYSTRTPVWTSNLDAFAMMRIGSSMSDRISLIYVQSQEKVSFLDAEPGWIGDATEGQGVVAELGLGARAPLMKERKIRCYRDDP